MCACVLHGRRRRALAHVRASTHALRRNRLAWKLQKGTAWGVVQYPRLPVRAIITFALRHPSHHGAHLFGAHVQRAVCRSCCAHCLKHPRVVRAQACERIRLAARRMRCTPCRVPLIASSFPSSSPPCPRLRTCGDFARHPVRMHGTLALLLALPCSAFCPGLPRRRRCVFASSRRTSPPHSPASLTRRTCRRGV